MKTFRHSGGGGDMIYGLATMYHLGGGALYLNIDLRDKFYKTLLEKQPYIKELFYAKIKKVDYNLDLFRTQPFNDGYTILECHKMAFNLDFDITEPWLFNVEKKHIRDIVINDTGKLRWEGITVDWKKLKKFRKRCIFIGLRHEHDNFVRDRFDVDYYPIKDALDFAQVIKGSKLYVGNQSTGLAIAEGLKHPRVADLYLGRSKQYPKGENGHWKISKELIEKYLNE
jgi:hypothetical protein